MFGNVVDGGMVLNDAGRMVRRVWEGLAARFSVVEVDEFVVMPNHVHGVIFIREPLVVTDAMEGGGAGSGPTLGEVVGAFKSVTTVEYGGGVRRMGWRQYDRRLWQRNYFERVVRDERELGLIREYIVNNAVNWESDSENTDGNSASAGRLESPWEEYGVGVDAFLLERRAEGEGTHKGRPYGWWGKLRVRGSGHPRGVHLRVVGLK